MQNNKVDKWIEEGKGWRLLLFLLIGWIILGNIYVNLIIYHNNLQYKMTTQEYDSTLVNIPGYRSNK